LATPQRRAVCTGPGPTAQEQKAIKQMEFARLFAWSVGAQQVWVTFIVAFFGNHLFQRLIVLNIDTDCSGFDRGRGSYLFRGRDHRRSG